MKKSMRTIFTTLLVLNAALCFGQVRIYYGFIHKYPIQLVTNSYSDGSTDAVYAYDSVDTPIIINGSLKQDSLILIEKNSKGDVAATLEFYQFDPAKNELNGKWINQSTNKQLTIHLSKIREFDTYDESIFDNQEFLQPEATTDHYFKLLLSKSSGEDARVTGVRIYEKGIDTLIQEIELECQFWGLNNIAVADYNFDGIADFSVFEASYAGPNTSSLYILREPNSDHYFVSDISGISLDFDADAKLIYEHSQSRAGRSQTNATYKLVNNKMVLIEQKCLEYDAEKEKFVEVECE